MVRLTLDPTIIELIHRLHASPTRRVRRYLVPQLGLTIDDVSGIDAKPEWKIQPGPHRTYLTPDAALAALQPRI